MQLPGSRISIALVSGFLASALPALAADPPPKAAPDSPAPAAPPAATSQSKEIDIDELSSETQLSLRGKDVTGMVWWIPPEFWAASAPQLTADDLKPLRQYVTVAVVAGKLAAFGVDFASDEDLFANTVLRDSSGKEYKPLKEVQPSVQMLSTILRPVMKNLIGQMGEHLVLLHFPAKNAKGDAIADPTKKGSFSVLVRKVVGAEQSLEWRLPLTSLSPAKYCPVGKERMKANWNFCPFHGVALDKK